MYDLIVRNRKLNKIKVTLAVLIVIVLILTIFTITKLVKNKKVEKSKIEYNEWIEKLNEEETKRIKEEEEKKYAKLSEEELERFNKIYRHQDEKRVFFTFDDGPSYNVTPYILDLLKQENIKATFFVLGNKVEANPAIVKRAYDEGHYIGNHGYSHKYDDIYSNVDAVINEYNQANNAIKNALQDSKYNSLVFRFPGGSSGGKYHDLKMEAKAKLASNGIASVDWNALTNDSAGAKTKEKIMESFYSTVKNKSSIVLLMHDAGDKILTYECLPEMISYFRENGYSFKSMYDIMDRR